LRTNRNSSNIKRYAGLVVCPLPENRFIFTLPDFLQNSAKKHPQKNLIEFDSRTLTYEEVDSASDRFAKYLQDSGIIKGDRIAIKLENSPEYILSWFGAAKLGAILVPINVQYKETETNQIIDHCSPKIVLTGKNLFSSSVPAVSVDEDSMRAMASGSSFYEKNNLVPSDPLMIIYTSGTTGKPKGVVQSHRTYVLTGLAFPRWLGLSSEDRLLTCLPLSHINAQAYSTMGAVGAGATLILQEKFSLSTFWDQARENKATEFNSVGAMLVLMYKHSLKPRSDHSVKIAYSAPALPVEIRGEIEQRFHLKVVFGYGLSESTFGFIEPVDGPRRPGSMGKIRSFPGFTNAAIIADEDDRELPTGSTGQILLQNAAVMNGYYRDDQRTRETLRNGFLHTGDQGFVDADGYYFFVDRSSDIIRRKGENISSSEIESVILSHPEVTECAVLGVSSELSDDEIVAFVVAKPASHISGDEIKEWCDERLARFKIPGKVFLEESLPKGATFRTNKKELRKLALERLRAS
jgi:carnitine-CoA ligase